MASREWNGVTSGTSSMHRYLIKMLGVIPLPVMYAFASVFVLPFYVCFKSETRRAITNYHKYHRGKKGLSLRIAVWRNHYTMMQKVIDRFSAFSGKNFSYALEGNEAFRNLEALPGGFILLSSHAGCTELVGYSMGSKVKQIFALVYAGEGKAIMDNRRRLLEHHNIKMIPVDDTLNHVYAVNQALADGNIVTMPSDRIFNSQKSFGANFCGSEAQFPLGPFATAVQRNVPLVAFFMMKEGVKRYRCIVKRIDVPEDVKSTLSKRQLMVELGKDYVAKLDEVVADYPYQWFNFYDFWNDNSR